MNSQENMKSLSRLMMASSSKSIPLEKARNRSLMSTLHKLKTMRGPSSRLQSCNMRWQQPSLTSKTMKKTLSGILPTASQTPEVNHLSKSSRLLIKARSWVQKRIISILKKATLMLWSKRVVCHALDLWILDRTSPRARQMYLHLTMLRRFSLVQI